MEHHHHHHPAVPVHNSEVYLLGLPQRPSVPPPSPPSPLTPRAAAEPSIPIQELCLDDPVEPLAALDNRSIQSSSDGSGNSDNSGGSISSASKQRLSAAIHVLNTEATALRDLVHLYETDRVAAAGFDAAIQAITAWPRDDRGERSSGTNSTSTSSPSSPSNSNSNSSKLVLVGVGKSGHIAKKLVATFNSLGVRATFLHPTEALHGDLGKIGPHDAVMFITFSGRTPELLALLPHIDATLPTIVLTSHRRASDCELARRRPGMVLLPAPIHEPETVSFGVSAPTTSTTVALALGDALAVVASQELHGGRCGGVSAIFAQNHPGGAIGAAFRKEEKKPPQPQEIREIAVPLSEIPSCRRRRRRHPYGTLAEPIAAAAAAHSDDGDANYDDGSSSSSSTSTTTTNTITGADLLKAGFDSASGWVRVGDEQLASPSRIRGLEAPQLVCDARAIPDLVVGRGEWITVRAETPIAQAAEWIRDMRTPPDTGGGGETTCNERSILAVVEDGVVIGVLEAGRLLEWVDSGGFIDR